MERFEAKGVKRFALIWTQSGGAHDPTACGAPLWMKTVADAAVFMAGS
jgi:hypothetical protein